MTKLVNDKYRLDRGGWSRILAINCKSCNMFLYYYQKDGKGPLKRCYLDRIIGFKPHFDSKGYIFCNCKACIGFNEPYSKENNRPAIRIAVEALSYKLIPFSKSNRPYN